MPAGPAELVGRHRQQVGAELVERDRDVARGRGGVDVHEHAALAARRDHLGDGLHGADLVVGQLHVHDDVSARIGADQLVGIDAPGAVDADDGDVADRLGARAAPPSARRRPAPGGRRARPRPSTPTAIASVAPLVNTTDRGRAPRSAATSSRAVSTATRASSPSAWIRPGSPPGRASHVGHRRDHLGPRRRGRRVVEVVPRHAARPRTVTEVTQWSSPIGRLDDVAASASP